MRFLRKSPAAAILFGMLYLAILWGSGYLMEQPWTGSGLGWISSRRVPDCSAWQQANDGGFGLPSGGGNENRSLPFEGEDGFEVLVYRDQLYVGMEADNELGARLWRTKEGVQIPSGQPDWEEVIADDRGHPWGIADRSRADHVDSLAEFEGSIYVSSASTRNPGGTLVFRSRTGDPGSWVDALPALGPGFGDSNNENFNDMVVFDGRLCGGTRNEVDGAEVWCTADGMTWELKNSPGFGDQGSRVVWTSGVFAGRLYLGVEHVRSIGAGGVERVARMYRTSSLVGLPEWELVFEGDSFSFWAAVLGSVDGSLYVATPGPDGIRIYRSATGDPGSWVPASLPGLANSRLNTATVPDGAVVYRNELFLSVRNPLLGFRVWRLRGQDFWEVVPDAASYNVQDLAAQLSVFNDSLYAWTTNYHSGQAILRTSCSAVP